VDAIVLTRCDDRPARFLGKTGARDNAEPA
jgi:hypothetical protein